MSKMYGYDLNLLKILSKNELQNEFRIYLQQNNYAKNSIGTFSSQALFLFDKLCAEKQAYVLSKQLLRSGTSIEANVREAKRAQSKSDFYSKMNIALKEADEAAYWLELLHESGFLKPQAFESIYKDFNELIKILVSILKTKTS